MMKNKEYLTDFLSAGKYGVILSIAVSLLLLTGGFLFQGFSLPEAFQVWRSGMCILSGISLFLVAGSILTKKSSKIDKHSRWREKFQKIKLRKCNRNDCSDLHPLCLLCRCCHKSRILREFGAE